MIFVLASIEVKPGFRDEFLKIFKNNVPTVRKENGCIQYQPTIDFASGFDAQVPCNSNLTTVIECWENLDALRTHLASPHMRAYQDQVKDMVVSMSLKIVEPA